MWVAQWLWVRREWRARWATLVLLAVAVAIAGGAAIASVAAADRTATAFPRFVASVNAPDLSVSGISANGVTELDRSAIEKVLAVPGVEGVTQIALMATAPAVRPEYFSFIILDTRGESMGGPQMADLIRSLGPEDVVVNDRAMEQFRLSLGDSVRVQTLTLDTWMAQTFDAGAASAPDGPTVDATVAARTRFVDDISDAPEPTISFGPAFYEKYHDRVGSCVCDVEVKVAPGSLASVQEALARIYPDAVVQPAPAYANNIADTVTLQRRAWFFIGLVASAAGIVVLAQAATRGRSSKVMDTGRRAVGLTATDLRIGDSIRLAPVAVVGALASGVVAYLASSLAPVGIARRAEPSPGLMWQGRIIATGMVVVAIVAAMVIAVAVSYRPSSTRTPRRHPAPAAPVVGLGTRFAVGAGKGATLAVFIGVVGVVGGASMHRSVATSVATPSSYGKGYEAQITVTGDDTWDDLAARVAADPGVASVELGLTAANGDVAAVASGPEGEVEVALSAFVPVSGSIDHRLLDGREPRTDSEVALSGKQLRALGGGVGDGITLTVGDAEPARLTVVGVYESAGADEIGTGVLLTESELRALTRAQVSGIHVLFAPGTDIGALAQRLPQIYLEPVLPPSKVGNLVQIGDLPDWVGLLLAGLGAAALAASTVHLIRSSRRFVAVHRALGFTRSQVVTAYGVHGLISGAMGAALGLIAGVIAGHAVARSLVTSVGASPVLMVPALAWISAAAGALTAFVAAVVGAGAGLRDRPCEALRVE